MDVVPDEEQQKSEARVRRLKVLVQLRRLYRNLIRGQCLLDYPSPVYSQAGAHMLQCTSLVGCHQADLGMDPCFS